MILNFQVFKTYGPIFLRYIIILIVFFYLFAHFPSPANRGFLYVSKPPRLCGWYAEDANETETKIQALFKNLKEQGIDCVNYQADIPNYNKVAKLARSMGLQIYAWLPAMLGIGFNKKWLYEKHPEVYVVTKSGKHSHSEPIYGVDHYKFLCPNHPIVRNYLKEMYNNVSAIPEIDGINLDYIRYIEANLNKYDPTGDTCYCDYCVASFYNKTGMNISEHDDPNNVEEWNNYRVNAITSLVNEISKIVHANGKKISADVYPGPWQSTKQTRQKWDEWNLDMVFPMIYTKVFARDIQWIGAQTGEGTTKLKEIGSSTILFTGLEAEVMNDEDFKKGVKLAFENGAYGVSVFRLNTINSEKFEIMRTELQNFLETQKKH